MACYSLKQCAEALGVAYSSMQERARLGRKNRKGIQTEAPWVPSGKQGKAMLYSISSLPRDVQEAIRLVDTLSRTLKQIEKAIARLDAVRRSS